MDRLREELTCAICYDIFEDPRVLSCSHTFCRECLQGLLQPPPGSGWRKRVSCPSCRARVAIPAAGPRALPVNLALQAVIDKCRRREAAGPGPGQGTCRAHPQQPLDAYCLRDRRLVCGLCLTVGEHRGHPVGEPEGSLCARRLQEHKVQCQLALQSNREAVLRCFNEMVDALEDQKAAVLSALDELYSSISRECNPLIEEVEKLKLEESESKELHSAVQEKSPLLFLEKLDGLQIVHPIVQKRLPDTNPVEFRPRTENPIKDRRSRSAGSRVHKLPAPQGQLIHRNQQQQEPQLPGVLWEPEAGPADRRAAFFVILSMLFAFLVGQLNKS